MTAVINETEIKLRIGDVAAAQQLIEAHGFHVAVPRVYERNVVLDNAAAELRESRQLLRLRQAGQVVTLTFKGVSSAGRHKTREERETRVSNFAEMLIILNRLGFQETFVYEKYRTEFCADSGGVITLDETPVGNFLELEGEAEWIDATAHLLGFQEEQYLTSSYGSLYLEWCQRAGTEPENMIFTDRA
jgi:adenylate cyclase class 2